MARGDVNTKKAAGNAKKAEVAAAKQAEVDRKKTVEEDTEWAKGSKSTAKQYIGSHINTQPLLTHSPTETPQQPKPPTPHARKPRKKPSSPKKKPRHLAKAPVKGKPQPPKSRAAWTSPDSTRRPRTSSNPSPPPASTTPWTRCP